MGRAKKGLIALAVAIAIASILYETRGLWLAPLIREGLESAARRRTGIVWSIERGGGNLVSTLVVSGVRAEPRGALRSFQAERLELNYSLWDFLFNREGFVRGLDILVMGARASLDLRAGAGSDGKDHAQPWRVPRLPAALPDLRIVDSEIAVRSEAFGFRSGWVRLQGGPRGGHLQVRGRDLRLRPPLGSGKALPFSLEARRERGQVVIDSLRIGDQFAVTAARVKFPEPGETVARFRADARAAEGRLSVRGCAGPFEVQLNGQAWNLSQNLLERLAGAPLPELGPLRAEAGVSLDRRRPELADAYLRLQSQASSRGRLELAGRIRNGMLRVEPFTFQWRGNRLAATASLPLADTGHGMLGRLQGAAKLALGNPRRLREWMPGNAAWLEWLEGLHATLIAESGRLVVKNASLRLRGNNRATIPELAMPLEALQGPWSEALRTGRGQLRAEIHCLPELLAAGLPGARFPEHRLTVAGRLAQGRLWFSEFRLQSPAASLRLEEAGLFWPREAAAVGSGRIQGRLEASVPDLRRMLKDWGPDLRGDFLLKAVLSGTLANPEGIAVFLANRFSPGDPSAGVKTDRIEAKFRFSGSWSKPILQGQARLSCAAVYPGTPLPAIQPRFADLHYGSGCLQALNVAGAIGDQPFTASGRLRLAGPGPPQVEMTLAGRDILLIDDSGIRIRTDLALRGSGPVDELLLSGRAVVTGGQYNAPVDLQSLLSGGARPRAEEGFRLFRITTLPYRQWRFQTAFRAIRPLRVLNNLAIASIWPFATLKGTGADPELEGRFLIGPSQVSLATGAIQIRSGIIEFPPGQPGSPVLDIEGQSRIQGYRIMIEALGWLTRPVITLTSEPPRSMTEILLLGLTGAPPARLARSDLGLSTGFIYASYLSKGVLTRWQSLTTIGNTLANQLQAESGGPLTGRRGAAAFNTQFLLNTDALPGAPLYLTSTWSPFDTVSVGVKIAFPLE